MEELIRDNETRLIVNINDLRKKMPERVQGYVTSGCIEPLKYIVVIFGCFRLLTDFVNEIICLEQAVRDVISRADYECWSFRYIAFFSLDGLHVSDAKDREFHVGFEGSFGDRHVNPRTLKSEYLGNMVCCEGIVTRCSLVRPKIVKSVHYCPATNKSLEKKYTDFTSYDAYLSSNAYPKEVNI